MTINKIIYYAYCFSVAVTLFISYVFIYFTDVPIYDILIFVFCSINICAAFDFFINRRFGDFFYVCLYLSILFFTISIYFYFQHYPYKILLLVSFFLILSSVIKIAFKWHNILLFLSYFIIILYYNFYFDSFNFINKYKVDNKKNANSISEEKFKTLLFGNKDLLMKDSSNTISIKSNLLQYIIEVKFENKDDTNNVNRSEFIQTVILQEMNHSFTQSDFNKIDSTFKLIDDNNIDR